MRTSFLLPGMILWLALCAATAAPAQSSRPCKQQEASDEFSQALQEIYASNWQTAITHLERAANLCPVPPNKVAVRSGLMVKTPYTPFFYLGTCRLRLKEPPAALRQFYLSSCFGEPGQGGSEIEALGSLTDTCIDSIRSSERPKKHTEFADGYRAAKEKKWEQSAEKMWDSMQIWAEDGKTTYSNGRWPEAYLPRFHLARALSGLGCQRQACEQLAQSLLEDLIARKDPKITLESQEMSELKSACKAARQANQRDDLTCERWECWLQEKGR